MGPRGGALGGGGGGSSAGGGGSRATVGGGGAGGGGGGGFGAPPMSPCTSASRAISSPTARSSPRRRLSRSLLPSLIRRHSSSVYSPTAWRTSASASSSSTLRRLWSSPDWVLLWRSSSSAMVLAWPRSWSITWRSRDS